MSFRDQEHLISRAAELGVILNEDMTGRLESFGRLLFEWNKNINLTRIPEDEFIGLHILDSLSLRAALDLSKIKSLIDVGTGAGFPGIPLAIAFPDIRFTLVDSKAKKLKFIEAGAEAAGLSNVSLRHARAEELAEMADFRENFDAAVARAVAALEPLSRLLIPLIKRGGRAVAMKGPLAGREIEEASGTLKKLNAEIEKVHALTLPGTDIGRNLIVLRKR